VIYDASALLALIFDEPGADMATRYLGEGQISTVNLAEVASLLATRGASGEDLRAMLDDLPLAVVPFDSETALGAGRMRPKTKSHGLPLGDRSCLALAQLREDGVLTGDRAWPDVAGNLGIDVTLIR